jgi:methyl-accepting chemotaxis protein
MKIKFKLSIMMIAVMMVVAAGISLLLLNAASKMSIEQSNIFIDTLAEAQVEYWEGRENVYMQTLRTLANVMADSDEVEAEDRRKLYNSMLQGVITAEPGILVLYTVWRPNAVDGMDAQFMGQPGAGPTGQYAMAFSRESGEIVARTTTDINGVMAHINSPNARKERVEHPAARTTAGQEIIIFRMMAPIINATTREVVGGVGMLLNIAGVQPTIEQTIRDNEGIAAMSIYSSNGFILGNLAPEKVGKMMKDVETVYGNKLNDAIRAVQKGEYLVTESYSEILESNVTLHLSPARIGNSDTTWTIMIAMEEDFILAGVNRLTRLTLIIALAAIFAAAAIIFVALNFSTKPLVSITDTLKDISEGEGDLTRTIPARGKDEIADLSRYFNKTIEKIKNLVVTIKGQADSLSNIGNQLANNMVETAAAVNQISANTQNIKGRVINQSASVTETNATMGQISINIDKLNEHIEDQSASVSQSSSAIEEMLANIKSVTQTLVTNADNVKELLEASDIGRTGLQDVASDIQEIARESEGLLEITSVMQNMASQTNLLSMNAAIVAAHAGEAGKGFAVVADEIRKLAENSSEQSKTISAVLKKIKESIDKITRSTGNVLNKFEAIDFGVKTVAQQEEIIRNAMEEQGEGSKQILQSIGQLNEITQQVKSGSSEMLEGSKGVIAEGKNLEQLTGEISGGMNEMATGTEQINIAINEINNLSEENREDINLLVHEVSKFKVE